VDDVGAENFQPLRGKEDGFDFDFNILTAFIRLGRAGPRRGPGALHIMTLTLIWRRGALHIIIF
jgi:hypothetical protein